MICVIVDHSRLSSLLTWFSYERFWLVTAAELFVALSGIVLGMVYGHKLARVGWRSVVRGLGRRALTLYVAFLAVTASIAIISAAGIDVSPLVISDDGQADFLWLLDPWSMNWTAFQDIALMRYGPWPFQIVALYVWLVAAAVPCLMILRFASWRWLLGASWAVYLVYRITPHPLTAAQFETSFPLMAWQLLFVHGITIGYHRDRFGALITHTPRIAAVGVGVAGAAFVALALCNPWSDGPSALHWTLVSPERFADLYARYFALADLGIGRVLNLAVALPLGYALLTWTWTMLRPIGSVVITLGQQSLGAFVLHVYGILVLAHTSLPYHDRFWTNTFAQIALILAIAALLNLTQHVSLRRATRSIYALVARRSHLGDHAEATCSS